MRGGLLSAQVWLTLLAETRESRTLFGFFQKKRDKKGGGRREERSKLRTLATHSMPPFAFNRSTVLFSSLLPSTANRLFDVVLFMNQSLKITRAVASLKCHFFNFPALSRHEILPSFPVTPASTRVPYTNRDSHSQPSKKDGSPTHAILS